MIGAAYKGVTHAPRWGRLRGKRQGEFAKSEQRLGPQSPISLLDYSINKYLNKYINVSSRIDALL